MADLSAIESIFFAAQEKRTPEDRAAFLQETCAGDTELRRIVERLLAAQPEVGSFLAAPIPDSGGKPRPPGSDAPTVIAPPEAEQAGQIIAGRYALVQKLGEGGMGSVWVAEQAQPVKRRVALKMIRSGLGTHMVLRRFDAERQALALMDHPNIAKILDAGETAAGQPFFVMELVKGVPITRYCDELHLPIRERLNLFVPVCQAIQHAHQKGIIHRDIKPSNVLVAIHDGVPVPKIIDFGVAKAVNQRLTEESMHTQIGAFVGTLEYMSPEQAELSELDIDTRADVYGLGVLLYELLTGTTPLNRVQLKDAAILEMLRRIKQDEPPRPSTRLTESKESLSGLAAQRRTEPARLAKEVRGDLDWIVMKCLEKDRSRRYESASGLARDVERFLRDEAVEAGPPTASYRLRKFLRRNKAKVLAASCLVLTLLAGLTGTTVGLLRAVAAETVAKRDAERARRAEEVAMSERNTATAAEKHVQEIAEIARTERDTAKEVNDFILRLFIAARPGGQGDKQLSLRTLLDNAATRIEKNPIGRPLAEAKIREILGYGYQLCKDGGPSAESNFERAYRLRQQHLGEEDEATQEVIFALASAYDWDGNKEKARPIYEKLLEIGRRTHGNQGQATIDSVYRKTLYQLAFLLQHEKKYAAAEPLWAEYLEIGQRAGDANSQRTKVVTMAVLRELAQGYRDQGNYDAAERVFLQVREYSRGVLGGEMCAGVTLVELGRIRLQQQKYADAEAWLREGVDLIGSVWVDYWRRCDGQSLLGGSLLSQKKYVEAETLLMKAYEGLNQVQEKVPVTDRSEYKARLIEALERLVQLYDARDKKDKADEWRKKLNETKAAPKPPAQP